VLLVRVVAVVVLLRVVLAVLVVLAVAVLAVQLPEQGRGRRTLVVVAVAARAITAYRGRLAVPVLSFLRFLLKQQ
jgi:ABC-type transporter Mla subunit MlaD